MASIRKIFLLLVSSIMLFIGCDEFGVDTPALPDIKPFIKGETVSRTLLVYIMAENSISGDLESDFNEIKRAAYEIPDDARLFVYFDNSDTTRLPSLYQYHAYDGKLVENVVYTFEEDICSSDIIALGTVLDVIFNDYPTLSFDMIMGSHASGWIRSQSQSAPNRTIGIDNGKNDFSNNTTATIEIEELAQLLERIPVKIDRLMFDACLMQGVETAYALRNAADWIIGSPAEIPSYGAPYDKVVPLFFDADAGVEDIMYEYKIDYDGMRSGVVLSAIRTCHMQELADTTSRYVNDYMPVDKSNYYMSCLAYIPGGAYTKKAKYPCCFDLVAVMKKIVKDADDYENWKAVFDKAVPYIMVSDTAGGTKTVWSQIVYKYFEVKGEFGAVSAYIPQNKEQNSYFNEQFRTTEWYVAAGWCKAGW